MGVDLVSITSKGELQRRSLYKRLSDGPVVHLFFTVALISSLIGIGFLGIRSWLSIAGVVPIASSFPQERLAHVLIQFFLFFGISICGFIIQSAPKVFNLPEKISFPITVWVLMAPVVGIIAYFLELGVQWPLLLVASSPLLTAICLVLRQKIRVFQPHSLIVVISLIALSFGPFLPLSEANFALPFFLLTVGGAVLGTSHIFIVNLLGGQPIGRNLQYAIFFLYLAGIALMFMQRVQSGALLGMVSFLLYIWLTGLFTKAKGPIFLRLGFLLGFIWALIAFGQLIIAEGSVDSALHVFSTGWGMTILFALSLHITGFIGGLGNIKGGSYVFALLALQTMPFARGFPSLFGSSGHFRLVYCLVWVAVLLFWLYAIYQRDMAIFRKTLK